MMESNGSIIKSDALLLLTAAIWGSTFVFQRLGMMHVGPSTYNGVRFALGAISLVPLLFIHPGKSAINPSTHPPLRTRSIMTVGALVGAVLFAGSSLQQIGLVYTTASNAGFITGLYIIIVPILGLLWKQKTGPGTWVGAMLATLGLYFLSVTENWSVQTGDLLVLFGAFFWAGHVLLIGRFSPRINPIQLAISQSAVCSILSLIAASILETITLEGLMGAAFPIFYGGFFSVGIAYTLQVIAQQSAHPAHAAILMSLESVFALLGGRMVLGEMLSYRGLIGCALMLSGVLITQLWNLLKPQKGVGPGD
jgi:drug/metabolite transporter (DMT)-like permease